MFCSLLNRLIRRRCWMKPLSTLNSCSSKFRCLLSFHWKCFECLLIQTLSYLHSSLHLTPNVLQTASDFRCSLDFKVTVYIVGLCCSAVLNHDRIPWSFSCCHLLSTTVVCHELEGLVNESRNGSYERWCGLSADWLNPQKNESTRLMVLWMISNRMPCMTYGLLNVKLVNCQNWNMAEEYHRGVWQRSKF